MGPWDTVEGPDSIPYPGTLELFKAGILGAYRVRKLRIFAAICRSVPGVSPINSIESIFD